MYVVESGRPRPLKPGIIVFLAAYMYYTLFFDAAAVSSTAEYFHAYVYTHVQ